MPTGLVADMIACYQVIHGAERKKPKRIILAGRDTGGRDIDDILFETLK